MSYGSRGRRHLAVFDFCSQVRKTGHRLKIVFKTPNVEQQTITGGNYYILYDISLCNCVSIHFFRINNCFIKVYRFAVLSFSSHDDGKKRITYKHNKL